MPHPTVVEMIETYPAVDPCVPQKVNWPFWPGVLQKVNKTLATGYEVHFQL